MSLTDYGEGKVMNHVWYGTTFTKPTTWYVGLFTVAPSESASGTEVTGNGYERKAVTFGPYTNGHTLNTNVVTFPAAVPAGWGDIVAFGIFETLAGGSCFGFSNFPEPITVAPNNVPEFGVGELDITAD